MNKSEVIVLNKSTKHFFFFLKKYEAILNGVLDFRPAAFMVYWVTLIDLILSFRPAAGCLL